MVLSSALKRLLAAGLRVEAIDGRLKVTPASHLTPGLTEEIRQHRDEILAELTSPDAATFESDHPTWLRRTWCRRFRHRFGWRDVHDADHCLTCCRPGLSAPVAGILEVVNGRIVEHDPFLLPDDGDSQEFIGTRTDAREHDAGFDRLEAGRMAAVDWWLSKAAVNSHDRKVT